MRDGYRGQPKAHPRHVSKAVVVNTWRLRSGSSRAADASHEACAACGWWFGAPGEQGGRRHLVAVVTPVVE